MWAFIDNDVKVDMQITFGQQSENLGVGPFWNFPLREIGQINEPF